MLNTNRYASVRQKYFLCLTDTFSICTVPYVDTAIEYVNTAHMTCMCVLIYTLYLCVTIYNSFRPMKRRNPNLENFM